MTSDFQKSVRWLTYFLAGFCVALLFAVVSLSQSATAVVPTVDVPSVSAPVNQFAQEVADTHRAPNFYQ